MNSGGAGVATDLSQATGGHFELAKLSLGDLGFFRRLLPEDPSRSMAPTESLPPPNLPPPPVNINELAPRTPEEQRIIDINKRISDAVVSIRSVSLKTDPYALYQEQQEVEGTGSGFIIQTSGQDALVLTNNHVVEDAHEMQVFLKDGRPYEAELIGSDPELDVAVLRIKNPPKDIPAVELGNSGQVEAGQRVLAIGNPFGLTKTLTDGMISSIDRASRGQEGHLVRYMQTTAVINPGNSGGPLIDMKGQVVGINTMIFSQSGGWQGIGFAVPIDQIKKALPDLLSTGRAKWPQIGIKFDQTEHGLVVEKIFAGLPAAASGLRPAAVTGRDSAGRAVRFKDLENADYIQKVNGEEVNNTMDVLEAIYSTPRGTPVVFAVRRGPEGPEREVKILAEWR